MKIAEGDSKIVNAFDDTGLIDLDASVYDLTSIFKTCYLFTDNCYLYLTRPSKEKIVVRIKPKPESNRDIASVKGEFLNELINQRVRNVVNSETGKIRELLVAQAFSESNLLDSSSGKDYLKDPLRITEPDHT